uniref:Uncharacterized protein n=1 Tax=Eptatretus burgeri TaxID=7764 RepID=A0A8C4QYD6_EPTBU
MSVCPGVLSTSTETMVLTVFSASNYFAPGSNLGAFVRLGSDLVPNCVQFQTGRQNLCTSSPHQCVRLVEQDAVKALREKLFTHRPELTVAFMERDPQCTGPEACSIRRLQPRWSHRFQRIPRSIPPPRQPLHSSRHDQYSDSWKSLYFTPREANKQS